MGVKRLITQVELAAMKGVTRGAVNQAVGGRLSVALVGKKIDLDHPAVVDYLAGKAPPKLAKGTPAPKRKKPPKPLSVQIESKYDERELDEIEVHKFMSMTLREILTRFGTSGQFKDYLAARKTMSDVKFKEISIRERQGELIERDFVSKSILGPMNGTFSRLLIDTPKTLAAQVSAAIKAGDELHSIQTMIHDILSAQIKNLKRTIGEALV